jgi:hypothetical protein
MRKAKDAILDLKVYISRSDECPSEAHHDIKYDFSEQGNNALCSITVHPKGGEPRFTFREKHIYLGLYSLQGLQNFSFIYGFGDKCQKGMTRRIVDLYSDKNPKSKNAGKGTEKVPKVPSLPLDELKPVEHEHGHGHEEDQ